MAVYILVALVAVAVLWGAYRVLGGAASRTSDSATLLRTVDAAARDAASTLRQALDRPAEPAAEPAPGVEAPRSIRRLLDGCAQMLERVDTGSLNHAQLTAHELLSSAVDDLVWATRIAETAGFGTNSGMQRAVAELRAHADRCLVESAGVLGSAGAEVVDSPA